MREVHVADVYWDNLEGMVKMGHFDDLEDDDLADEDDDLLDDDDPLDELDDVNDDEDEDFDDEDLDDLGGDL